MATLYQMVIKLFLISITYYLNFCFFKCNIMLYKDFSIGHHFSKEYSHKNQVKPREKISTGFFPFSPPKIKTMHLDETHVVNRISCQCQSEEKSQKELEQGDQFENLPKFLSGSPCISISTTFKQSKLFTKIISKLRFIFILIQSPSSVQIELCHQPFSTRKFKSAWKVLSKK